MKRFLLVCVVLQDSPVEGLGFTRLLVLVLVRNLF